MIFYFFVYSLSKCELSIENYILEGVSENCNEIRIPPKTLGIAEDAFSGESGNFERVVFADNCINELKITQFQWCERLKEINLEALTNLKTIPIRCFKGCKSLLSVTIPKSVKSIETEAFNYCSNLIDVSFERGSNLRSIHSYAFYGTKITSLTLPSSVSMILDNAFSECLRLSDMSFDGMNHNRLYKIINGMMMNIDETKLIYLLCGAHINKLVLPDTIKTIGAASMRHNNQIEELVLPESLTLIEENAIQSCERLTRIVFNKKLRIIYSGGVSYLPAITVLDLSDCSKLTFSFRFCKGCNALEKIIFPSNTADIKRGTLENCDALKEVHAPEKVIEQLKSWYNNENYIKLHSNYKDIAYVPNDAIRVIIRVISNT